MATPLRVLIAEDSPDDAALMVAQLQHDGFELDWRRVQTEPDFLAELNRKPDVILSDFAMPQFSGLRAAQLAQESGLNIPFILISGTVGEDAAVEAMKCGATDYLLKDRIARLGKAIERALEQKRLQEERRRAQEELHWKSTLLEAQLESAPDGILVVDRQGKKILQNRRLVELFKVPEEIVNDEDDSKLLRHVTGQMKYPEQFRRRVASLYANPDEIGHDEVEMANGMVLDRYSAPVRDRDGKNYGRIWTFRDITERRRLEAQFRQAQKMESIGQLAGGIAHDFNNILAAISGNLYLARQDAAGLPDMLDHLECIDQATRRATALVNQILTFSRQNKQEREPLKLNNVVLEALKLLRASVPATIRIQTDLTTTPTVLANATAIHQVIMNLGTNAWHAMRDKPGILKIEMNVAEVDEEFAHAHPGLHAGRYVRLTVSDTGHGMDAATLERIFDPFFTTKSVGDGTGLGLAVVLGIMQSHDGVINVYSQPGEGATFQLYVPVFDMAPEIKETVTTPIPRGHGEHILFVDDEESLVSVGKRMLERLGYTVTAKTSAMDALAAVRDHPGQFDLVITDLTMPVMDGARLGRQLLQLKPNLPILLSTGYTVVMTEEKVKELGFRGLLIKPSTAHDLGEAVHHALVDGG
ncbi:MAG TPA: response regulator [Verrucomicrobiae bacterium]